MDYKNEITRLASEHHINSSEFNGLACRVILREFDLTLDQLKNSLKELIQEDKISINFGDRHPNPYIKALPEEPAETQIAKLDASNLEHVCVYPSRTRLAEIVDTSKYENQPFTLRLALGEAQLALASFDLTVLEVYRNDPRYYYINDDISGSISITDEYYQSAAMSEADKVLLESFGFAYDSDFNRAVCVCLRYLTRLSPEHQQIWKSKELQGEYKPHPDYYRQIIGDWGIGISIFDAFIEELKHINAICQLIGRPNLFREDFKDKRKPREFSFLIRPTLKEFNDFIHLLDKLLSDNINRKFFLNDVSFEREEERGDGKIVIHPKGTVQILEEWLRLKLKAEDPDPIDYIINPLKKIRKLRQRPAHAVDDNVFNQEYFKEQRELIMEAYDSLNLIRHFLNNHPKARSYKIPDNLDSGKIWVY
ncbi:MAG TPA: hypothetical protein VGK02_09780 [Candidatus Aquicultor sp.]|jgi:hypothetical protein